MTRSERQRTWRQRRATGLTVLQTPVPHYQVVEALIAAGRLSIADALDKRRVEHAAAEVLVEWAKDWTK